MREILFRGKDLVTGEWVYGDLYHRGTEAVITSFCCGHHIAVDPATVGQFTGLLDKAGKRIFEGDIVRGAHIGDDLMVEQVEFSAICGWTPFDYLREGLCDVIGNTHDTPELLEVNEGG